MKALAVAITLIATVNLDDATRACGPDAFRFCSAALARGQQAIIACLRANERFLSPACRALDTQNKERK